MKDKKYALIDDGSFSGKFPFVRFISNSETTIKRLTRDNGGKLKNIIEVTEQEFAYMNLVPNEIEILYRKDLDGNRFFY